MWFVEHDANKIGRIDMTGAVNDFDIPTPFTQTEDIAAGADGALWFAEFQSSKIGRITTAGVVTEFQIPNNGGALPSGITAGPDGNIWFTETVPNKIGRITTAGVITEYAIPTTSAWPLRITAGPDGALWFTEEVGNKIGRITTGTTCPAIALSPTTLPDGAAVVPYTPTTLTPTSGTPPYTFNIPGLPAGMTPTSPVNGPSVTIAGTPAAGFSGTIPVTGTDANGCPFTQNYHLFIDPGITVVSITPRSGPAAGGTSIGIDGTKFLNGATVTIGGVPATGVVVQSATHIDVVAPPLAPGVLNDVVVTNPGPPATATLGEGFFADFLDVPQSDPFHGVIEKLVRNKIAAGCGLGNFCPSLGVPRGSAMVLILAAEHAHDPSWILPAATGTVFADVPIGSFAAAWIETAFAERITAGCFGDYFCPGDWIDRKQAAVFLLVAKHGFVYAPPPATGTVFVDVPLNAPMAKWIEEFANEGITAGCGFGYFCPDSYLSRRQMAAFLVATFGLP
jgi:hypothetical protein